MKGEEGRTALVLGSTGLVGRHLTDELLQHPLYRRVVAPVRRATGRTDHSYTETVVSFDRLEEHSDLFAVDDVFCCIGTIMRVAGSQEAFRKVDYGYPVSAARISSAHGARGFLLVSSLGADTGSRNFYLRVKGETEREVFSYPFEQVAAFRPSMLLGERQEGRWEDRVVGPLVRGISPLLAGPLKKYRGVEARVVARSMVRFAVAGEHGAHILESDRIQQLGGSTT